MKRSLTAIAALTGALLAAQPAIAASVEVQYDDLDLATAEGKQELDRRIDKAAENVCDVNEASVGTRVRTRETRDCIKQAKRQIADQLASITKPDKAGG
jgi:UrcA family protein